MFQELMSFNAAKAGYERISDSGTARRVAAEWFKRALRQGRAKRFPANLLGRPRQLCNLMQITRDVVRQHYVGLRTVALSQIHGSENRTREFDVDFYPLEEHIEQRWLNVAVARLKGDNLPPIELIQFGDVYYVRDGHHRVSVAHALGQQDIEAVVTVGEAAK